MLYSYHSVVFAPYGKPFMVGEILIQYFLISGRVYIHSTVLYVKPESDITPHEIEQMFEMGYRNLQTRVEIERGHHVHRLPKSPCQ